MKRGLEKDISNKVAALHYFSPAEKLKKKNPKKRKTVAPKARASVRKQTDTGVGMSMASSRCAKNPPTPSANAAAFQTNPKPLCDDDLKRQQPSLQESVVVIQKKIADVESSQKDLEAENKKLKAQNLRLKEELARHRGFNDLKKNYEMREPVKGTRVYCHKSTGEYVCPTCFEEADQIVPIEPCKVLISTVCRCPSCESEFHTSASERKPLAIESPRSFHRPKYSSGRGNR